MADHAITSRAGHTLETVLMNPAVVLIQQPAIDFNTLLSVSQQGLGYSLAAKLDRDPRQWSDAAKLLLCLAAFKDQDAKLEIPPHLLRHVSFSLLMAVQEHDSWDILSCAAGMSFVTAETVAPAVLLVVLTGRLDQWRDAVVSGTEFAKSPACRAYYCRIHQLFEQAGLARVWSRYHKRETPDSLYVLDIK
jgi:hypothetical protein